MPVQPERDPVGLADLQRCHVAQRHRDQLGQVLAHHLGLAARVGLVADLQQRHRVEVHDRMQPAEVVRVGITFLAAAVPDVRPAQPQATVTWRDQVRAKGPEVGEDARAISDAAPGERRRQGRVVAQHLVALVPLVQRDVRLLAGQRLPGGDGVPRPATPRRGRRGRRPGSSRRPAPRGAAPGRSPRPGRPWPARAVRSRRSATAGPPPGRAAARRPPAGTPRRSADRADGAARVADPVPADPALADPGRLILGGWSGAG